MLNNQQENTDRSPWQAWSVLLLLVFFACVALPAVAQNTKGDKPTSQGPLLRFPKIKSRHKGGDRPYTRDISGRRRVRTKNYSSANRIIYAAPNPYAGRKRSKTTDRAAQPLGKIYNTPPHDGQRAWRGSASGSALRIRSSSATRARNNVYSQHGRYVNNPARRPRSSVKVFTRTVHGENVSHRRPRDQQRASSGGMSNSASGPFLIRGRKNVYWGKFSKGEKPITHDLTGRALLKLNFQSASPGTGRSDTLKVARQKPGKQGAGQVRGGYATASKRGERAWSGDVSGHPIRRRSARAGEPNGIYILGIRRSPSGKVGNNPLPARTPGIGASSIARILRKMTGRKQASGGGSVGKSWNNQRRPIDVRAPGVGASGVGGFRGSFHQGDLLSGFSHEGAGYAGNFRSRGKLKGGGSVSGRFLNNNGRPIDVRTPGVGAVGIGRFQGNFRRGDLFSGFSHEGAGYSGNFRSKRPLHGGGSVSGKFLNNGGRPVDVRVPAIGSQGIDKFRGNFHQGDLFSGFSREGARYSGNMRSRRPLKGGGSLSGKVWNNNNHPLQVRGGAPGFDQAARFRGNLLREETFRDFGQQGYGFSGNMKAKKPQKGGGSISERIFNNSGHPIDVRPPGSETAKGSRFSGSFRAKRPDKGGGSISSKIWNTIQKPVDVRPPGSETAKASRYSGTFRAKRPEKGGGSISGKVWNNNEKPIDVHPPGSGQADASRYSGSVGLSRFKRNYVQSPRSNSESLKKKKPNANVYSVEALTVKNKQETYRKKPHANANALPGIGPKNGTVKASEYSHAMKMTWAYKHNPSSNVSSLDVKAPGKAYARINDYQGNMRMRKYNDRNLHPDAQFAHGSRDNTKEDRTLMMNLKLLWAKLFRKNDTQPAIVKEKERRPRYDKKEKELWKALYD